MGNNQQDVITINLDLVLGEEKNISDIISSISSSAIREKDGKEIPSKVKVKTEIINSKNPNFMKTAENEIPEDNIKDNVSINNLDNSFSLFNKRNSDVINDTNSISNINNDEGDKNKPKDKIKFNNLKSKTRLPDDDDTYENINTPEKPQENNIDLNIAKNNKSKDNKITINGTTPLDQNLDNNEGSYYKKSQIRSNNIDLNDSKNDLELSQSVYFGNNYILERYLKLIQQGYIPLFMKLDDYQALFFFIRETSTLKSLLRVYLQHCPKTDEGLKDNIKLYNEERQLDINKRLKDLNLGPFSIIRNVEKETKGK